MRRKPIPILMYHQVAEAPPKSFTMRGLVVAPSTFARHMAAMHALGYRGLSMRDLEPYLLGQAEGKVFGITFDDGYLNNLENALPVLRKHGFTATCYVVADLIGQINRWDDGRNVKKVPLMNREQLLAWAAAGQEIGSHSLSHPFLNQLSDEEQTREIQQSKAKLEELLGPGARVDHFCYPYGAFNSHSIAAVKAAGYRTATTTNRGRVFGEDEVDLLLLPRVLVTRRTTWPQLLLKCFTRYEDRRGQPVAALRAA